MNCEQYQLAFDRDLSRFKLMAGGKSRVEFDDFELNFRMGRANLKSGRLTPLQRCENQDGNEFALTLKAMGSSKVIWLADLNGSLYCKNTAGAVLISYKNDFDEINYSPDKAVCLSASSLAGVDKMVLFHNRSNEFQNFDCEGLWWSQAAFIKPGCKDYYDWGMLLCMKFEDGRVGALLPCTNRQVLGRIQWNGTQGLSIISCCGASGIKTGEFPIAFFAISDSVHGAIDAVIASENELNPDFKISKDEALPAPFDKLGWCSWNAFGPEVRAEDIQETVRKAKEVKLPIDYVLIDDGWLDTMSKSNEKALAEGITSNNLQSLDCDRSKFPEGIKSLAESIKKAGISHVGLWHTLNGYWNGLSETNETVMRNPDWFIRSNTGSIVPSEQTGFYDAFHSQIKSWGIDFVKIDNQGFHRRALPYQVNMPGYMASIQKKLHDALDKNSMHAIYCMATHPEVIFNCRSRQLLRISNDFSPNDAFGARRHIVNNFYNDCWLSKIFWPDYDMFQSEDACAETFARMLAVSGSPIYVSDRPEHINLSLLHKLVLPSGIIPRYTETAQVLESEFFSDPYSEGKILAVKARYNDIVTIGLFNTVESGATVTGSFTFEESGLAAGEYLIYGDWNRAVKVQSSDEGLVYSLKGLQSSLVHIAPIVNGFAIIGNTDYFAAPAIIESVDKAHNSVEIQLKAPGEAVCYCETEPKKIETKTGELKKVRDNISENEFRFENHILRMRAPEQKLYIKF